ncbi:S-formylglutathione hydrolase [bacterium]|nr:S-formylglutathione hydrolase [bacterium]
MSRTIVKGSESKSFGGWTRYFSHESEICNAPMRFSVYLPPQAEKQSLPVVYWLSGLSCSEDNFMAKAGAQRVAAELGLILIAPDTSPRGLNLPGDSDHWDFGVAAGFYVNALQAPWSKNYRMYDYVTRELPEVVAANFPVLPRKESIFGHSMGGHGALIAALRQPGRYASVSAFAPICAPIQCPWGQKAFKGYLGAGTELWKAYDTTLLVESGVSKQELFVDQGMDDKFLVEQLKPELLEAACRKMDHPLRLRRHAGYDHSYFFIASFVEEHLRYHASRLQA